MATMTLAQIAVLLECPVPTAAGERSIAGISTLEKATAAALSYLGSNALLHQFAATRAGAVIVQKGLRIPATPHCPVFRVDDADLALAAVLQHFAPPPQRLPDGVDRSARVAPSARIAPTAAIGPNAVIGQRTTIGEGTIIHSGVYVGDDVTVGNSCEIFPNVVVRERITIGNRVTIHAASVLGTDGFGYRWDGQSHLKIPQIGTVVIEDDVEIGSCVCIDRAKFGETRVGHGAKIDNLVQIAHNVAIGPNCIIVAQVGIAGSTTLGANVTLAGQVGIGDHLNIGDGASIAAQSGVTRDIAPHSVARGTPSLPFTQYGREQGALRRLPQLIVQVRLLQKEIEKLKEELAK